MEQFAAPQTDEPTTPADATGALVQPDLPPAPLQPDPPATAPVPTPPFSASLTGAVTPLSEARVADQAPALDQPSSHQPAPPPLPPTPTFPPQFPTFTPPPLPPGPPPAASAAPLPAAGNGVPIPAPIESTIGRSPQTIIPPGPPTVDNRPAVDTHAAGGPFSGGDAAARRLARRRRRSASLLPPLPSPMDIPEDAPGRVAFLAAGSARDFVPAAAASADVAQAPEPASAPGRPASPVDEWLSMAIVGVAMLVVFVAGLLLTR